jgi:hypothetical protein
MLTGIDLLHSVLHGILYYNMANKEGNFSVILCNKLMHFAEEKTGKGQLIGKLRPWLEARG